MCRYILRSGNSVRGLHHWIEIIPALETGMEVLVHFTLLRRCQGLLSTASAVPSLPCLLDLVFGVCTPTCTYSLEGKGGWISLSLVTSKPLQSHTYLNIPASTYC